ncbi:MAG TPA: hydrogenase maturation protease [Anaerolineales bacterium]|nr:hydrogenase maturation protease [Anaerolineales bacterium]
MVDGNRLADAANRSPILVLGVGNILLRDEGVGVRVIEALREMPLPEGVELLDGGTAALDLVHFLAGRRKLIVVDAVQAGQEPGAVFRFTPDDLSWGGGEGLSLHQMGLLDGLAMADLLADGPPREVVVFGVQPGELGWGLDLSPAVAAAVSRVVRLVLDELGAGPAVGRLC